MPTENEQAAEGSALIERTISFRLVWILDAIILFVGMVILAWIRRIVLEEP